MEWTPTDQMTLSQMERQEKAINAAITVYRHSRNPGWILQMRKRVMDLRAAKRRLEIEGLEIDTNISQIDWYRWNN